MAGVLQGVGFVIPAILFWFGCGVAFSLAGFLAWRQERIEREASKSTVHLLIFWRELRKKCAAIYADSENEKRTRKRLAKWWKEIQRAKTTLPTVEELHVIEQGSEPPAGGLAASYYKAIGQPVNKTGDDIRRAFMAVNDVVVLLGGKSESLE